MRLKVTVSRGTEGIVKLARGVVLPLHLHRLAAALPKQRPRVERVIVVLAEEIFASRRPILVVLEARSHYILEATVGPDRKGHTWCQILNELEAEGDEIEYVVADLGSGLLSGTESAGLDHLPDLMHLLHPLSPFLSRFEHQAEGAIAQEYERQRVLGNSRRSSDTWKTPHSHLKQSGVTRVPDQSNRAVVPFAAKV